MNFGYSSSFKTIDKGLIEQFGPTGFASSVFNVSFNVLALQSGYVYHTIFIFVYGFGLYFFAYFLISLGFFITVQNTQFFLGYGKGEVNKICPKFPFINGDVLQRALLGGPRMIHAIDGVFGRTPYISLHTGTGNTIIFTTRRIF